jgi:hypothetical protein
VKFLALISDKGGAVDHKASREFFAEYQVKEKTFKRPKGVRILEGGKVFGPYTLAIIYEAPNDKVAWDFLREFMPYWKIERFLLTPCGWCERTKASQTKEE